MRVSASTFLSITRIDSPSFLSRDRQRQISSRIVVLHQGRLVLDGTVDAVVNSDVVRTIYAGGGHV